MQQDDEPQDGYRRLEAAARAMHPDISHVKWMNTKSAAQILFEEHQQGHLRTLRGTYIESHLDPCEISQYRIHASCEKQHKRSRKTKQRTHGPGTKARQDKGIPPFAIYYANITYLDDAKVDFISKLQNYDIIALTETHLCGSDLQTAHGKFKSCWMEVPLRTSFVDRPVAGRHSRRSRDFASKVAVHN